MRRFVLVICLVSVVFAVSCTSTEKVAYRTVVGANAFLMSVKANHPECGGRIPSSTLCTDLRKATAAKDLLIDAGEAYCNESTFAASDTNPCNPSAKGTPAYVKAEAALQAALSGYNQAEADLKGVIK